MLRCHAVRVRTVRVYELARALGTSSSKLISRLRTDGEWVSSHLSVVAPPVANRLLPGNASLGVRKKQERIFPRSAQRKAAPAPEPVVRRLLPQPRRRRRPGPAPLTMQSPDWDEYGEPIDELRYLPEISTRDVAELGGVTQATVRRWVARGYISPVGKLGASNLFSTKAVFAAFDGISGRRRATGKGRRQQSHLAGLRPFERVHPRHFEAVVDVREAARLINVAPATIRSWIHRGQLTPITSSKPRAIRLRVGDVIDTARARQLPQRATRARHRR